MKNILKRIVILTILITSITTLCQLNFAYAGEEQGAGGVATSTSPKQTTQSTESKISDNPLEVFDPNKSGEKGKFDDSRVNKLAEIVMGAIRAIGIVVAVIILMVLGIKQMTASVEEKSLIKQAMPRYILGAVMVFAMTTIPSLIYNLVTAM